MLLLLLTMRDTWFSGARERDYYADTARSSRCAQRGGVVYQGGARCCARCGTRDIYGDTTRHITRRRVACAAITRDFVIVYDIAFRCR